MTADIHALAGAYALDALPPEERRFFEAHLDVCSVCRHEVNELIATAAMLGVAVAEPPPADLRARVLAQIDVTRQDSVQETFTFQRRRGWWRSALVPVAASLVLIIGGLTVAVDRLGDRLDRTEREQQLVAQVMAAPDSRVVPIDGPEGSRARLIVSESAGHAVFVADDLPDVGRERAYALWLIGGDGAVAAGLVQPSDGGETVRLVEGDVSSADAFGVTVEPAGGSEQPTTDILMFAEI